VYYDRHMIAGKTRLICLRGDITKQSADAIVNAANTTLLGGGGVDGAIHRVGGPAILEECRKIRARQGGCKVGEAVITSGGRLPARFVIHTVGPVWRDGESGETEDLAKAYESSLRLALESGARSIAFPSISTGAFGFPIERAAPIAVRTARAFVETQVGLDEVRFVLFEDHDLRVYQRLLDAEDGSVGGDRR
jgi:O-acetyl-ADP-ribose deacetylase (regulator of RNase III)